MKSIAIVLGISSDIASVDGRSRGSSFNYLHILFGGYFDVFIPPFTFLSLLSAINDSCLVYDGSLVIDANFHTNDLSIRGAGPLTKFKRKYHAEPW